MTGMTRRLTSILALWMAACGGGPGDGTGGGEPPDSVPAAVSPAVPRPDVEEWTAAETFARGLPYYVSEVRVGDPPGIVVFAEDVPITFRYEGRGESVGDVHLVLEAEMAAGSTVSTPAPVALVDSPSGKAAAVIEEPLGMILGVPGAEAYARMRLVATATGADASNTVVVPYRVVEAE